VKAWSVLGPGFLAALVGCTSPAPIQTADHVVLERFMGDWYVIANIPTFLESGAFNAMESYRLNEDGTIATTFRFRKGGFDGREKTYRPTGFVTDHASNAVWDMQFLWPFKAEYRILFVDADYRQTIIGRVQRDYVWIMARTPTLPEEDYRRLLMIIADQGYDIERVQMVPQRWDEGED
jgi:apolipoprotein D and lipocalin family protein